MSHCLDIEQKDSIVKPKGHITCTHIHTCTCSPLPPLLCIRNLLLLDHHTLIVIGHQLNDVMECLQLESFPGDDRGLCNWH